MRARDAVWCLLLFVVVAAGFLLFRNNFVGISLTLAVPYGVVVVGMVLQIGYGRQLALSQVVFMALGAYGVAILNVKMGLPVALSVVVVVVASVVVSAAVAAVVARVGGLAIGLVTLFLVVMVADSIIYSSYLGGTTGMGPVAPLLAASSAGTTQVESGIVAAAVLAVATLVVARILRDDVGAEISVLGASSRAAASLGIRGARRRMEIFVLGSVLATLGGALFAGLQGFVSPTEFDPNTELTLLLMLFLGGQISVYCALVGPFLIAAMPGISSAVANNITLIEGGLFTILLTVLPMGIGGLWQSLVHRPSWPSARRAEGATVPAQIRQRLRLAVDSLARPPGRQTSAASVVEERPGAFRGRRGPGAGSIDWSGPGGDACMVGALVPAGEDGEVSPSPRAVVSRVPGEPNDVGAAPVLYGRGLTKSFGGVAAVRDVTITVEGPGVYCIVGPNGAGKSTLLELISGGYAPDRGTVVFRGQDVTGTPAWRRARMGMSRTFQNVELCDTLSPLDNVAVAALPERRGIMHPVLRGVMADARLRALQSLATMGTDRVAYFPLHRLTLAQERNVELARALVGDPHIILLDEPASGLSVHQRAGFAEVLANLSQRLPIILVEHDLDLVAKVAKVVVVLVEGEVIYEGGVEGFEGDPAVRYHLRGLVS